MKTEKITIYYNGKNVEVSREVSAFLSKTDRRLKYYEHDIKEERYIRDENGIIIEIIPSREDSFERLQEDCSIQFADKNESVEDIVNKNICYEQLHNALAELRPDERALIDALFFHCITQREYASMMGVAQVTIYKKKKRILCKLKKILNL